MAETSKNKIYYNDNEDSIADVLEDMKKLAESTDNAIEKAKYNDTELKNKNTAQDSLIEELQTKVVNLESENTSLKNQIPSGEATGNPIHLSDSSDMECEIVPIGGAEQEMRSGKNLANISNFSVHGGNGHTFPKTITNLTANTTYTLSFTKTRKSGVTISNKAIYGWAYIDFYNGDTKISSMSNGSATSNFGSGSLNFIKTIQTPENCNKIIVCFDNNNGDTNTNTEVSNVQLEEGSTATEYEQYGASPSPDYPSEIVTVGQNGSVGISVDNGLETTDTDYQSYTKVLPIQKEFVKINDTEDTFVKVDGKWYEAHYSPKVIFDGSEDWSTRAGGTSYAYILNNTFNKNKTVGICSHWNFISGGSTSSQANECIASANTNTSLSVFTNNSNLATLEQFKTWLAQQYANGTPVIVYYVVETPELIPCTAGQEEILNSFYTYKNVTNISVDGIGTLKVNYKKDLETIINKLSATSVAE